MKTTCCGVEHQLEDHSAIPYCPICMKDVPDEAFEAVRNSEEFQLLEATRQDFREGYGDRRR